MYLDGQTVCFDMFYHEHKTGLVFERCHICSRFRASSFVICLYYAAEFVHAGNDKENIGQCF
jgi:hypothetical protein